MPSCLEGYAIGEEVQGSKPAKTFPSSQSSVGQGICLPVWKGNQFEGHYNGIEDDWCEEELIKDFERKKRKANGILYCLEW